VQDPHRVRVFQGFRNVEGEPCRVTWREAEALSPGSGSWLAEEIRERGPMDQLHGMVVDTAVTADRKNRNNMRMIEQGRDVGLDLKSCQRPAVENSLISEDFESQATTGGEFLSLVHDAHATPPNLSDQSELAKNARAG
jgi:hypothetical protein